MKLITFANTNAALLENDTEDNVTLVITDDNGKPIWYLADLAATFDGDFEYIDIALLEGHPYTPWFIQHDLTESDLE